MNSAKKIKNRAQKRKHRDTIFGTAEHEKINTQREKYASIFGTPKHENLKAQRREKYANIYGTPEHENLKTQQREKYANIFGTPQHENLKAQQREKYASIFGTSEHESIKRTMRDRYTAISRTQNNKILMRMILCMKKLDTKKKLTASDCRILICQWRRQAYRQFKFSQYDQMRYRAFEKTGCLITANGDSDDKIQPEGISDYISTLPLDFDPFTTANVPVPLARPEAADVLPESEEEENEDDEDRNIFSLFDE